MINLQDISGLPLLLDTLNNLLHPAGEIYYKDIDNVRLKNIRPILLNKTLRYPSFVYYEYQDICLKRHRKIFSKNKLHHNILILPPGLLGIEFIKSHIFAPDKDQNDITTIVEVLYGSGVVLFQEVKEKGELDFETSVNYIAMVKVNRGDRVAIPQNYMYTFINPKNRPFVISRLFEDDGKIDYRTIWRDQGMAYYFIRKNARQEIVKNPHYKQVPVLKKIKPLDSCKKYKLTSSKPIYIQFINNEKRFRDLLV